MILIAHRGNINGSNPNFENDPRYLQEALAGGFHVEVDVWSLNGMFMLGHDAPQYVVNSDFLRDSRVWCHAKNELAMDDLWSLGAHYFWHENDERTLTSQGWVWTHPRAKLTRLMSVQVDAELKLPERINEYASAVCSDYVSLLWVDK